MFFFFVCVCRFLYDFVLFVCILCVESCVGSKFVCCDFLSSVVCICRILLYFYSLSAVYLLSGSLCMLDVCLLHVCLLQANYFLSFFSFVVFNSILYDECLTLRLWFFCLQSFFCCLFAFCPSASNMYFLWQLLSTCYMCTCACCLSAI